MNNVMTPSGASTAVTGAPGVMVPPAARWTGLKSQRRRTTQTGPCPRSESSGDPPGGRAHQPPPLAGVQAAHPRRADRKRTAGRTGIQAKVKLTLLRGQPLPRRGLQQFQPHVITR